MGTLTPGNGLTPPQAGRHAAITPNRVIASPAVRKGLYAVAGAVGAILLALGLVTAEQLALWAQLGGSLILLATAVLAAVNTPSS